MHKIHSEYCIQNAMQSAIENMSEDASPEEHRAEAINYIETGISECYCTTREEIEMAKATEVEKLMAAYIDLANTDGAEQEESYAAWALILELAAMAGLPIPTHEDARALLDSIAENSSEIYSEEEVLKQERNGML